MAQNLQHELVEFPNGSFSMRSALSPEPMHSRIGPWQEARRLYVEQSRLEDSLAAAGEHALVLHDLGMGIAANALAAIECALSVPHRRALRVVSFEMHVEGLRTALRNASCFPWVERHREAVEGLLSDRRWEGNRVSWELREGDYLSDYSDVPPAELVYFDFYSPKTSPELWGIRCFEKIRAEVAPNATLYTYGASTAARAAMLLAGFHVGSGAGTGDKTETTVAAVRRCDLQKPLGPEWLARLERSSHPLPPDCAPELCDRAMDWLRAHPQFGAR